MGAPAKIKILFLGSSGASPEALLNQVGSLNIEHVSPAELMRPEISRHRGPAADDEAILVQMRRWFWARKPDAGFVLTDFPATLLQAIVFDEWLAARAESLDGVIVIDAASASVAVVDHYRTHGLLRETADFAAA